MRKDRLSGLLLIVAILTIALPTAAQIQSAKVTGGKVQGVVADRVASFKGIPFDWPTWAWAQLQSLRGRNKAYVYYFDHRTPATPDGANHGSEISFVFRNFSGPGGEPKAEEFALSDLMSSYWVNFAKSGDPNGPGLPKWPAFSTNEQNAMIFDSASSARQLPNLEKLKAFDSYYAWRRAQAKEKAGAPK